MTAIPILKNRGVDGQNFVARARPVVCHEPRH